MHTLVETIQKSGHGTWIEIRLDRLSQNLKAIQGIHSPAHTMAVVKANAYGHGLLDIARSLEGQVTYLGVSSIQEILELKERGVETPVFLFGRLFGQELAAAVKSGATLSISSYEEALEISEASRELKKRTTVHIKVDTGMGRLGIPLIEAPKQIERISRISGLLLEGIYTHFPTAEREDGFAAGQVVTFEGLLQQLEGKGIRFKFRHAANSAGNLKVKSPFLNLIRPGLTLYGIYPDESLRAAASLSPVMSLKSRIILLKDLRAGQSVGYGREYVAKKATTIATLPIGYSHGYPVHLSNRAFVLFRGKRYPLAGRVSMDYISVDLGSNSDAQAGDEVTLLGEDGKESIRAEELAKWAHTIPYEIVTRLSARLPRFFFS